jgi:hypothetical protein
LTLMLSTASKVRRFETRIQPVLEATEANRLLQQFFYRTSSCSVPFHTNSRYFKSCSIQTLFPCNMLLHVKITGV